jgi:hypothetical protein
MGRRVVHKWAFWRMPFLAQPLPYLAHARVSMANLHDHGECGQCQLKAEKEGIINWSECACLPVESLS